MRRNWLKLGGCFLAVAACSFAALGAETARPRVARWIAHPYGDGTLNWSDACDFMRPIRPSPVLRKRFTLKKPLVGGRLYVTGLGFFEAKIDGKPVSDDLLVPAPTAYDRRWRYKVYALDLASGEHIASVQVGDGFYRTWVKTWWGLEQAPWTDHPKMFFELEDAAGKVVLASDETWKARYSPIVRTCLRGTEDYDARCEFPEDETDGPDWLPVLVKPAPGGLGEEERQPPCRAGAVHGFARSGADESLWTSPVNVAGVPRIVVRGKRGAKVTLCCGEHRVSLRSDGSKKVTETGFAEKGGTYSYVLRGAGEERWQPKFTYHAFDRVKVTVEGEAEVLKVDGVEIHTDFPRHGEIRTGEPRIMRLVEVCERSALGNFVGIPTDCPHREKLGWLSESRIMSEFMLYAWSSKSGWEAYVDDIVDAQRQSGQLPGVVPTGGWGYNWGTGPAWWCALPLIADSVGRFTGDWALARRSLPAIVKLSAFCETMSGSDGLVRFGLGDWLYPDRSRPGTPLWFATTGYAAAIHDRAAELCLRFGETESASVCRARAERAKAALLKAFYRGKGSFGVERTTPAAMALELNLVPPSERAACAAEIDRIVRANGYRVDYGTLGSSCVLRQLFENGYADTAYEVMIQPELPGYQVLFDRWQLSTLPEEWDPDRSSEGTESRFHGVFSAVGDTMYRYLAGFRHDADLDGSKEIRIRPSFPTKLNDFAAEHAGYKVTWWREGKKITIKVSVPADKTVELQLPGLKPRRIKGEFSTSIDLAS